jgi:gliding motility-associated-like protein
MRNLFFITSTIVFLSSCCKDDFDPKPTSYNYEDTTYYIDLSGIPGDLSFCLYPYNSITLDATTNDTSATYLWGPGGETTSSINLTNGDYCTLNYFSNSTGAIQLKFSLYNCNPAMYVPNAFSPNSDGISDKWRPVYSNIETIKYEIRDYEGVKVFSTNDLGSSGWDGTYQNVPMPSGFYLYYINYSTLTTENNILTGSLELIR